MSSNTLKRPRKRDSITPGIAPLSVPPMGGDMYARIARIGLRPGTEDQDLRALRAQGVPAFESLDGFVSLTAYLSRDDHVGYLVTHWDSRDHALAVSSAASVRDFFERIQDTVAAPPTIEVCEVAYSV